MGTNNDIKPDDEIVITGNHTIAETADKKIDYIQQKQREQQQSEKYNLISDKRLLKNSNGLIEHSKIEPSSTVDHSLESIIEENNNNNDNHPDHHHNHHQQNHQRHNDDHKRENIIDSPPSPNDDETVQCIFLCEFHVTAGRKIAVQVPENFLTKDKFETVSRYIIPQVQLQRSFLSVSLLGIKILGYPVRIDNKQYARNAFYFNICFVFAPTTRTLGYEPVVRKLSEYLLAMESSNKILSQQFSMVQKARMARLLTQVRNDINSKKMCMLQEGSTLIPLCVVPRYPETVKVYPHQAAALTDEFDKYVDDQWDLTTSRILPYINGFNHASRITALADVALELVCDCIKHLVILGVAVIVPVFQYSNVYRPTPKLSQLAKCRDLQRKCIDRCSKSERQQASVRDVFRMFASMAHGATFGELCVRFNPAALNINEKQMVLFGQLEGLIRRVEKYPVTISRNLFDVEGDDITKPKFGASGTLPNTPVFETIDETIITPKKSQMSKPLPRVGRANRGIRSPEISQNGNGETLTSNNVYNGLKSFDEICCANGMNCQELDAYMARDKHVIVLLK